MSDTNVVVVPVAVIVEDGLILLTQRKRSAHFPLLWECPGGKREGEETDEQTLQREIEEELGLAPVRVGRVLAVSGQRSVSFPEKFLVHYYEVFLDTVETSDEPLMLESVGMGWFTPYELGHLNVTPSLFLEREKIAQYMKENPNR